MEFETMRIGQGSAYVLGQAQESVEVMKTWAELDGRVFIVESIPYITLQGLMARAGFAKKASDTGERALAEHKQTQGREGLVRFVTARAKDRSAGRLVAAIRRGGTMPRSGVVWDYRVDLSGGGPPGGAFLSDTTYNITGDVTISTGTVQFEAGTCIKSAAGKKLTVTVPITWGATIYRPVIFTAKDDDSMGEIVPGSTHTPSGYYANPALEIRASGTQLRHLRVAHAQVGVFFHDFSAGNGNSVDHAQFVNCGTALQSNGYGTTAQNFRVGNLLMHNVGTAFYGYSFNGTVEHLTVNGCTTLADTSNPSYARTLLFRNGVFASVAGSSANVTLSGSGNGFYLSTLTFDTAPKTVTVNPFQTPSVGAGAHYLASSASAFRNAGSSAIDPTLAADLKTLTTEAPLQLTSLPGYPLAPRATRDTAATPNLGYHYAPLDYLCSQINVGGSTLVLTNGVAVGLYGNYGFAVGISGVLASEGLAGAMNRIVWYPSVQEQPVKLNNVAIGARGMVSVSGGSSNPKAALRFRFTDLAALGKRQLFFDGTIYPDLLSAVSFTDCWLRGIDLTIGWYPAAFGSMSTPTVSLTNNALERATVSLFNGYQCNGQNCFTQPLGVNLYNNLFWNSSVLLTYKDSSASQHPVWNLKDNLYDNATNMLTTTGGYQTYVSWSNNGYVNYTTAPVPTVLRSSTDVPQNSGFISFSYAPTVGDRRWYQASTDMINHGSRNADLAGLYHYTTQADQTKELTSLVDIGFHYVRQDPREGLVAQWRLDEQSGTTAADGTGRGHTGTVNGVATWAPGRMANALNFDGTDDAVSVPNAADLRLGTTMTIAFWLNKNGEPSDYARLVGKGASGVRNYGVWTCPTGANYKKILFQLQIGANYPGVLSSVTLEANQWYHVACTYDGATAKIYINGSPSGSASISGTPQTSTDPLTLGYAGYHTWMNGTLDDVRIYNGALNAGAVALLASTAWEAGGSADLDGDGLADYFEDRDGDNFQDTGETKLNDPDTDYDGRSDAQELAEATNPLDPGSATNVCLGSWRFNDPNWSGDQGQLPKVTPVVNVQQVPSWRAKALQVNSASPANLNYRDVEANGSANINCRKGTVRFWFQPDWSSQTNGGTGPESNGRLIELGLFTFDHSFGHWYLGTSWEGNYLYFWSVSGGVVSGLTKVSIAFDAGVWHEIVVTYGPDSTAIYVDGQLAPAAPGYNNPGPAVTVWPGESARAASGMRVGSSWYGYEQAKGQFEELETFNYALSAESISTNFVAVTNSAAPFAIGVYGDLQYLAGEEYGGSQTKYNEAIGAITNWISTNNLKVVLCSGDLVDLCGPNETQAMRDAQWNVASNAWKILTNLTNPCLVAIAPGNHEYYDSGDDYLH